MPRTILSSFIVLTMYHSIQSYSGSEYCSMQLFNATCKKTEVVVMDTARYGRMNIGKCVKANYGYLGCAVDVQAYMDTKCSGRHYCNFTVPDPVLHETKPCPGDFASYLDARFHCEQVEVADKRLCHTHKNLLLTKSAGYIASVMAADYSLGSVHCPWRIQGEEGQRINITLWNFARTSNIAANKAAQDTRSHAAYGPERMDVCFEVAEISDGAGRKTVTLCGGDLRKSLVFVSSSNAVQIHFINRKILDTVGAFMFHYQVYGCPDMEPLPDAVMKRSGNTLMVRCNGSGETWYLTCRDTQWVGETGNCSYDSTPAVWGGLQHMFSHEDVFPYGILIVVAIGVALGIFVGGVMLGFIVLYSRGRHRRRQPPTGVYDEVKENQGVVEQTPVHLHPTHHTAGWYRDPRGGEREAFYTDEGIVRDYRAPIPNPHAHFAEEAPGQHGGGRGDSESESEQLQTHAHGAGGAPGGGNYNSFSSFRPPQTHVYESPIAQ